MGKILFSPIGTSDPIRKEADGPWLHCCRYEKPDRTLIYLTARMCDFHHKDNRYKQTLDLLCNEIGKQIEFLPPIERPQIKDPHKQSSYDSDFANILIELHKKYPEDEILVNCSSGTPAIKSSAADVALQLSFPIRRLQVSSPADSRENAGEDRVGIDYDTQLNWEFDKDNESAQSRLSAWEPGQHDLLFSIYLAKGLIHQHDYHAASVLLENCFDQFREPLKVRRGLQGANSRLNLYLKEAGSYLGQAGVPKAAMIRDQAEKPSRICAEMLLTMQVDVLKKDYASMLRKTTPLLCEISELYLRNNGTLDIDSFVIKDYSGKIRIRWDLLQQKYPDTYHAIENDLYDGRGNKIIDEFVSTQAYLRLLNYIYPNSVQIKMINLLRNRVEINLRNYASHSMIAIDEKTVKDRTTYSPNEIINILWHLIEKLDVQYADPLWKSYDSMDDFLCSLLTLSSCE